MITIDKPCSQVKLDSHKQFPLHSRITLFVTVHWKLSDSTTLTPTVKKMLMLPLLWTSFNKQYDIVFINVTYTTQSLHSLCQQYHDIVW